MTQYTIITVDGHRYEYDCPAENLNPIEQIRAGGRLVTIRYPDCVIYLPVQNIASIKEKVTT